MKLISNLVLPCGLLFAVTRAVAVGTGNIDSHQLRRESSTAKTALVAEVKQFPPEKNSKGQRTMDMITKFRAEVCFKMKQEHGVKFESFEACEKFMANACDPGRDKQMDGDKKEVTSGEGYCKEYFPEAEKKAKAIIEHEDEEAAAHAPHPAPAPAPSPAKAPPAPAPAKAAAGAAPASASAAPAPGPAGSPGPGPAPVPAPFIPGVSGGKPYGAIAKDDSYYYKKGGKDPSRLHMNEDLGLPEGGYWGKLVEHDDQKTVTEDWGKEFGPKSGHDSYAAICREHPDSQWCQEHGGFQRHHSSCPDMSAHVLPLVLAIFALRAF